MVGLKKIKKVYFWQLVHAVRKKICLKLLKLAQFFWEFDAERDLIRDHPVTFFLKKIVLPSAAQLRYAARVEFFNKYAMKIKIMFKLYI